MTRGPRFRTTWYNAYFATSSSIAFVLCAFPCSVHASVVISEFLYDAQGSDTGKEWIELFNTGSSAVDISKWKINDGSNHVLNEPPKNGSTGSMTLAPGARLILAGNAAAFLSEHVGLGVSVIDTMLNLPNAGGSISLVAASSTIIDSVSYTKSLGAAGDSNSLQKTSSGKWIPASPTPGSVNSEIAVAPKPPPEKASAKSVSTKKTKVPKVTIVDAAVGADISTELDAVLEQDAQPEIISVSDKQTAAAGASIDWTSPWFLGAIGIAVAGAGAGFVARKSRKTEWDIEEMSTDT